MKINTAILYPALKKLEEDGLIESYKSEQSRGAKQRKNYILTGKGFSFIQSLFAMSFVPDLYLQSFEPEIQLIKNIIKRIERVLVINGINFLDAKELLATKYIYPDLPSKIKFIRYIDLKTTEITEKQDVVFVTFPFFIHYDINDSVFEYLTNLFNEIKRIITEKGIIMILDVYWERNAITDIYSFLITGEAKKMGFTIEEMEDFLIKKMGFTNFSIMKQDKGVLLFTFNP